MDKTCITAGTANERAEGSEEVKLNATKEYVRMDRWNKPIKEVDKRERYLGTERHQRALEDLSGSSESQHYCYMVPCACVPVYISICV